MNLTAIQIAVLRQLQTVTWDGNVESKSTRDELVAKQLVIRTDGYNVVSRAGVHLLVANQLIDH